jgi:hypothetical protein
MGDPFVVGMSAVAMMSLIPTGMPDSGPGLHATAKGRYSKALSTGSTVLVFPSWVIAY